MKMTKALVLLLTFFSQSCDCHYLNTQAYVKCLEENKGNEQHCITIRSQHPVNSCESIDYGLSH